MWVVTPVPLMFLFVTRMWYQHSCIFDKALASISRQRALFDLYTMSLPCDFLTCLVQIVTCISFFGGHTWIIEATDITMWMLDKTITKTNVWLLSQKFMTTKFFFKKLTYLIFLEVEWGWGGGGGYGFSLSLLQAPTYRVLCFPWYINYILVLYYYTLIIFYNYI